MKSFTKENTITLFSILLIISGQFSCSEKSTEADVSNNNGLFTLIDPQSSGVKFNNKVVDEENFNILTYRNFYNGGGVAIGDINNDSLPDLYFTANQQLNKLYLNKGNFVFEDITEKAGVAGTKPWSTGVTMADVNGDGWLDIYVCNSGDVDGADKENELFINNGNLTFTEQSKKYNLNNLGYSTHAAFFDYDLDGDLDCYILNNSFKDPGKIELYRKVREEANDIGGDKLMRNDGDTFVDITREAGIYSSDIGFGLGVAISDLNADRLPDIYISNDFWERDYLYINQGQGKFKEELIERMNYCSVSSMGSDIADINNDGSPEIFSTDMLPADNWRLKTTMAFDPYHLEDLKYRANFHYQMIQNCLHLNNGDGDFQEIALLSGVAATDWSWGALIFDFENDGTKDIFVSNGIYKDIMSMDFRDFLAETESSKGEINYLKLIAKIPSQPLKNYAFRQEANLLFVDRAKELGLSQPSFSNGSAYGDLDNDGDLDLVVNNINSVSSLYRNETSVQSNHFLKIRFKGPDKNPFGIGSHVQLTTGPRTLVLENFNTRGFESSIEPILLFGLGNSESIDELKITWPDNKIEVVKDLKVNQTITVDYANAVVVTNNTQKEVAEKYFVEVSQKVIRGDTRHVEDRYNDFDQEILMLAMLSTEGPRIIGGDINNDKQEDFLLLGAAGDPDKLFLQKEDGTFSHIFNESFKNDAGFESTCGAFIDYDVDGDLDLMIGSGGNEIIWNKTNYLVRTYKNDGRGNFTPDIKNAPPFMGNFSTIEVSDFDNDGRMDVFLGARMVPGNYGLPPKSFLLKNEPGYWMDMEIPEINNAGMVTDASWADIDSDNDQDLVVVGDWSDIKIFKNDKGNLNKMTVIPNSKGWWTRVHASDLDNDGKIDFVLGNWGLNSKFKASAAKPLTMFVNDFDNNGKSELIINWYPPLDTISYPFAPKNEITSQLPALRKSVLKYQQYGSKTYDSLFNESIRKTSIKYEVNYLESAILWNDGKNFSLSPLPLPAQVSPVYGIITEDFDGDNLKDIWLGGNFYALKPQVGRHDANKGVIMKGGNNRSFVFDSHLSSELRVKGEVRDVIVLPYKATYRIMVARNNASVLMFQKK